MWGEQRTSATIAYCRRETKCWHIFFAMAMINATLLPKRETNNEKIINLFMMRFAVFEMTKWYLLFFYIFYHVCVCVFALFLPPPFASPTPPPPPHHTQSHSYLIIIVDNTVRVAENKTHTHSQRHSLVHCFFWVQHVFISLHSIFKNQCRWWSYTNKT